MVYNIQVTVNQGSGDTVALFCPTSIPLTEQIPITDVCGGIFYGTLDV